MKYFDFVQTIDFYQLKVGDDAKYGRFLAQMARAWPKSDAETAEILLEFLNKWGRMRLKRSSEFKDKMTYVIGMLRPYLEVFRSLRIEAVELDEITTLSKEKLSIRTAIVYVFEMMSSVGHKVSDVATTKCLHLMAPSFFVIWDNTTRDAVATGLGSHTWKYANDFTAKVKADLEELLEDAATELQVSRSEAIRRLEMHGGISRTMAKRIDEYYFSKYKFGFQAPPRAGNREAM